MLKMFVGHDPQFPQATWLTDRSATNSCDEEVRVRLLDKQELILSGLYWREAIHGEQGNTPFAFTRFLVPYLSGYKGYSVFVDNDFLFRRPINEILSEIDPNAAVSVVQHEQPEPKKRRATKMDGRPQYWYPRKNWSSLMVFNNALCTRLTPELVSTASAAYLHELRWVEDDDIGSLDARWNFLVGTDPSYLQEQAFALHFTNGGPWFHRSCESLDSSELAAEREWFETYVQLREEISAKVRMRVIK